ncbi:unnamed protein product [Clavelina lepadiformis]|uniref:C3/C5 convertase n=1 Tax=Clavelina lepadiformis TaxID=159417 RepID=A0ABP0F7L6_CLALP
MRITLLVLSVLLLLGFVTCKHLQQTCGPRNQAAADAIGRPCRKICELTHDITKDKCKGKKLCLCDYECGFSCINPENKCDGKPPSIENLENIKVIRVKTHRNGTDYEAEVFGSSYEYSDQAIYNCQPGYKLQPDNIRSFCHGRKGWTHITGQYRPRCLLACRNFDILEVVNNNMICGDTCVTNADCQANTKCMCDGHCGRRCVNPDVDCGTAPPVEMGTIEYSGEGFEKVAHYSCAEGYFISSGSPSRSCTGGGTWDGQPLVCERVECGDPSRSIEEMGGEVRDWVPGPYHPGQSFTFRCRSSKRTFGSTVRTCQNNGRWSGRPTVCDDKDDSQGRANNRCIHPGIPVNGRIIGRSRLAPRDLEVGDTVIFECNPGYSMVGERVQECLEFLQWTGNGAPLCVDPRFRDSVSAAIGKLEESARHIQENSKRHGAGRFISNTFGPGHEIYFVIDLSKSVSDTALNNSLTFCVKLIERLTANATGEINYGIIVFALRTEIFLNLINLQPSAEGVIEILRNIYKDRANIQERIKQGTNTYKALEVLAQQLEFSYIQDENKERKRHVFILTDGKHNDGPDPEDLVFVLSQRENPPTFYSITTCLDCIDPVEGEEAYTELLGLAQNKYENFIFIDDFYNIQSKIDLITNATIDYSACGQAGDVGSVKQQARVGRVLGGNKTIAADRSWPWQAVITKFHGKVVDTYKRSNFYGGGSVINNRWVLTAAHLFEYEDKEISDWANDFVVTFGLHKRPTAAAKKLLPIVKIFVADQIIIHESYANFDFDIALIKIGHQLVPGSERWEEPILNVGWVNYTDYIRPVCLPCMENNCLNSYLRKYNDLDGTENEEESCTKQSDFLIEANKAEKTLLAVATGFGHTLAEIQEQLHQNARPSTVLRQGLLKVQSFDLCDDVATNHIDWGFAPHVDYTDNMLCAVSGNKHEAVDTCKGDSGGPLVREVYDPDTKHSCWVQIGIVSWGYGCGQSYRDVGIDKPTPGYYTNLMKLMPWVKAHIAENPAE